MPIVDSIVFSHSLGIEQLNYKFLFEFRAQLIMLKLFFWSAMAIGCMAMPSIINSHTNEQDATRIIKKDLPTDEIPEPSNFLLTPEEQDLEHGKSHKREKKSPWASNQVVSSRLPSILLKIVRKYFGVAIHKFFFSCNLYFQYNTYAAQGDPNVQQHYAPRNYYQHDQPAELARSQRRYRTTESNPDFQFIVQQLNALFEQEKVARQRRLRQAEKRSGNQNNFEQHSSSAQGNGGSMENSYSMYEPFLGGSQEAAPRMRPTEPETGSGQQNYPYHYVPAPPAQPPYSPSAQPPYSPPAQPQYSPAAQPQYSHAVLPPYSPPAQPPYSPPAQPQYAPPAPPQPYYAPKIAPIPHAHAAPHNFQHLQPQPAQHTSSCANNLLIGCQPKVESVPCSGSYDGSYAQPFPVAPAYPIQPYHAHPVPSHYRGLNSPRAMNDAPSPTTAEPLPSTKMPEVNSNSPRAETSKTIDVNEPVAAKPLPADDKPKDTPKAEFESTITPSVVEPEKEGKAEEKESSKTDATIKQNENVAARTNSQDNAYENFRKRIEANKRVKETEAQIAVPARVDPIEPPTVNRPLSGASPLLERSARSEYNNVMW